MGEDTEVQETVTFTVRKGNGDIVVKQTKGLDNNEG